LEVEHTKPKIITLCFLLLFWLSWQRALSQTWKELLDQADSLSEAANYDSAIVIAQIALERAEGEFGGEDTAVARVLNGMGKYHYKQANYDTAESLWGRALAIREKALGPDHPDVAQSLDNLGVLYRNQGKYEEAEPLHKRALAIREKAPGPDHPDVARSLNNLAILYCYQGKYTEAEPLYKRALAISEKALGPDHPDVAGSLSNLGALYWDQGKYTEAEPLNKRALGIWEKALGPDHPYVAGSLNNLAVLYVIQGKYREAEPLYKRALAIRKEALGPDHPRVAGSLDNLGVLYQKQGKYTEAEPLHKRALAIWEKALGSDHPDVASSLDNLGVLYRKQGKYTEAEPLHKRALGIWEKALGPDHPDVAGTVMCLAVLYATQGKYTEAEPLHERALAIFEKALGHAHPLVALSLESFSQYFRLRGDSRRSLEMAGRAFEIRKENFRDGSSVMSEKDALTYSQFMRNSASNFLSAYFAAGLNQDSLDYVAADVMFSTKGQASEAIFIRAREIIMMDQLGALADSLRYARTLLSKLYVEGVGEEDPADYRESLDKASDDKERFESELARTNVTYRDLQATLDVSAKKVMDILPQGSILIEYMRYDYVLPSPDSTISHYLAVVLSGSGGIFVKDIGEASLIDPLIDEYRRHFLHVSSSGRFPTMVEQIDYEKIGKALYAKVWKPVEEQISEKALVLIAPDGGLNMVSFGGLMDDEGRYLIDKFPIHYLSSGRDLIRLQDEAKPASGLFALGDPDYNATAFARLSIPEKTPAESLPEVDYYAVRNVRSGCGELREITVSALPGTRSEVEKITSKFQESLNEPVVAYFGADASEEHFKEEAPDKRVIHLATHGYFIQDECQVQLSGRGFGMEESYVGENPLLLSGLFLAGANLHGQGADSVGAEDGILTAEEVTAMNLDGTELVVLSACETGLGEVKEGEGVYGLRRAFQMAGARTVISALWPVSDKATAEMMSRLYERKDESLPERIRKLQLETITSLRSQKKVDHPFSWGAFIAMGDWR